MSQKIESAKVESAFEKFAENAGWETDELAEHVYEVFAEDDEGGLMDGINFEDETDDSSPETSESVGVNVEDMAHGEKTKMASKGVKMGVLDEYPGNSHDALNEALKGNIADIEGVEGESDDSSPETSETEGYNVPYADTDSPNDPESYDNPEEIMSREDIRNHSAYDGETPVNKLMHYQGKHGICEGCNLWAAMSGDTCNKCRKGTGSSGGSNTSNDGLTVADIQDAFGVNAQEARDAKEAVDKNLYGSVKAAIDA